MTITMKQYETEVLRTAVSDHDPDIEQAVAALGLVGESGEVAEIFKKVIGHGHDLDKDKVVKELGDVYWYLTRITLLVGSSLEEVAQKNVDKLRVRYPNGFSTEASVKRVDVTEVA